MALIKSQLVLTDGMTGPLRSVHKALNLVLNSFESMQATAGKEIDLRATQNAREELSRLGAQLDELENKVQESGSAAQEATPKFLRMAAAVGAVFSIKNIIGLADTMTQTQARLNLITSDLEKTAALQDQIMDSANRSRASYQATADAVAKMGIMAKDAFSSTDELVAFSELINKQFTIAGTSTAGQEAAMLQLTQAMASGVLRGEELNSIFEQAPTIIQTVADYLNVPIGQIRNMAAEGQITAEIVKNAMLSSADEINAQFNAMPYTFAQVGTMIQNILLEAFEPLIQTIGSSAQWIYENWSRIEPVILGVASAVGILVGAYTLYVAIQKVSNLLQTIAAAREALHTGATIAQAAATKTATGAQIGLNAALLASPYTWIVIVVAAVIGIIIALIKWIDGLIQSVGGLQNAWEIFTLATHVGWSWVKLAFFTGVYWVIDLIDKLKLAWQRAGVAIANFLGDMKVSVLTILQNMINGAIDIINKFIGVLNKIPGVNISAIEHVTFATTAAAENEAAKQAREAELAAYEQQLAENKAARDSHLDDLQIELDSYNSALHTAVARGKAEAAAEQSALSALGADVSSIADSTGSTAAALDSAGEDMKYMRDLAEQEAINRFTTAEVHIDMTGMTNRIDSDMDLDGVLTTFTDGFAEALATAAEGVHR